MGTIHLGHEQGLAESWQRDRGLHENAVAGLRCIATLCEPYKEEGNEQEDTGHRENPRSD